MARLLVIMGSGETAPTMVKPHRMVFEQLGPEPVPAVLLDTPYGFQENADDISARAVEYFAASVGRTVEVAELRRTEGADPVRREGALAKLAASRWVFAGPGSPTYALSQWTGTEVPQLLADKMAHGGCVTFASAAALTLGRYSVPVYEIYKVGAPVVWAEGMDLVATPEILGPDVAIIPHFNNAEGGNHDTRYCYLGERRLAILEAQLPDEGWVLGVDEHTGCVLDLEAGSAAVVGQGVVTVRRHGRSAILSAGETVTIDSLRRLTSDQKGHAAPAEAPAQTSGGAAPTHLHGEIRRLESEFDAAAEKPDAEGAVRAILELERTLAEWAQDTTQSDASDRGEAALRRMVVRLGELAEKGVRDPRDLVGPFVDALLRERASARAQSRYRDADRIRDVLVQQGIEVHDTPEGTEWDLAED